MSDELVITRPDDWHVHLRDGAALSTVVPDTALQFGRAIVMPNLVPPVTDTDSAFAYRQRILEAVPDGVDFTPLMTLYLTDATEAAEIDKARNSGAVYGVKLYPAGATTHSDSGVTAIDKVFPVLERMSETGMPLLVHGEVTDDDIDVFDREQVFIERVLEPLVQRFESLRVVFEHVTTAEAVAFVRNARAGVAATITPQHLLLNRNALLAGRIRPHNYCLPVLKTERDREALVAAATSGDPRFFLGTDSAPHARNAKETACGCAGVYTAHAALALYAEVFDETGALDKLESFASFNGADFYGLPRNEQKVRLIKKDTPVPKVVPFGDEELVPFRAGKTVSWTVETA